MVRLISVSILTLAFSSCLKSIYTESEPREIHIAVNTFTIGAATEPFRYSPS